MCRANGKACFENALTCGSASKNGRSWLWKAILQLASIKELGEVAEVSREHNDGILCAVDIGLCALQLSCHLSDSMLDLDTTSGEDVQLAGR